MALRITLSFGRHHAKEDVPGLKSRLRDGRYGLFVDDSFMRDDERLERIKSINEGLERVRMMMGPGFRIPESACTYNDAIIEAILPVRGLKYYLVEGYSEERLENVKQLQAERDSLIDVIFRHAISTCRVSDALHSTRAYLNAYQSYIRTRNDGIIEGFLRLENEAGGIFSDIPGGLSVFARFGSTHGALPAGLASAGLSVETVSDPVHSFTIEIVSGMTAPGGTILTEPDVAKAMFSLLYGGYGGSPQKERMAFEELGFETGFIRLLDGIAGTRGASDKFASALRRCQSRIDA